MIPANCKEITPESLKLLKSGDELVSRNKTKFIFIGNFSHINTEYPILAWQKKRESGDYPFMFTGTGRFLLCQDDESLFDLFIPIKKQVRYGWIRIKDKCVVKICETEIERGETLYPNVFKKITIEWEE